jgi:hypothetical protein
MKSPRGPEKRKERGSVWYAHRLAVDAAEKTPRGIKKETNEAACGIHAASSSTPRIRALAGIKEG